MYPVSLKFLEEIKNKRSRAVYAKVVIDYTDLELDESVVVTTNEQANVSYPYQTADGVATPIGKILSLDGSCSFDGVYTFAPLTSTQEIRQMGWWGSSLSGTGGVFSAPYPTLTMNFMPRTMRKITVVGDVFRQEYPVDFKVRMYNEADTLLHTHTVTGNTGVDYREDVSVTVTNVNRVELEISKWSHVGRQVKILEFYTIIQEVYEDDDIIDFNIVEQKETSGTGLPFGNIASNQISLTLSNEDRRFDAGNTSSPLYRMLRPNRRLKAYLGVEVEPGVREYVPMGVFYTADWDVPEGRAYAKVVGYDRLNAIATTNYSMAVPSTNTSLKTLATNVLLDAGLEPDSFNVDDALANINVPVAFFPNLLSHREVLRKVAEASLGQVFCDKLGVIQVEGISPTVEITYPSANEENAISCVDQTVDGITETLEDFVMLDGLNPLDGTKTLGPSDCTGQVGWVGTSVGDAAGAFSPPYPTLTLDFEPRSVTTFTLVGYGVKGEYPVDFTVRIYDSSNTLLVTKAVTGNASVTRTVSVPENPITAVKMTLEISKWSVGGTAVKILDFPGSAPKFSITTDDFFTKNNPLLYDSVANAIDVHYAALDTDGVMASPIVASVRDEVAISEMGLRKHTLQGNELIQTEARALETANLLIERFVEPKQDLDLSWRGNPALGLNDIISVDDSKETNAYRIAFRTTTYSGALRSSIKARRAT